MNLESYNAHSVFHAHHPASSLRDAEYARNLCIGRSMVTCDKPFLSYPVLLMQTIPPIYLDFSRPIYWPPIWLISTNLSRCNGNSPSPCTSCSSMVIVQLLECRRKTVNVFQCHHLVAPQRWNIWRVIGRSRRSRRSILCLGFCIQLACLSSISFLISSDFVNTPTLKTRVQAGPCGRY